MRTPEATLVRRYVQSVEKSNIHPARFFPKHLSSKIFSGSVALCKKGDHQPVTIFFCGICPGISTYLNQI